MKAAASGDMGGLTVRLTVELEEGKNINHIASQTKLFLNRGFSAQDLNMPYTAKVGFGTALVVESWLVEKVKMDEDAGLSEKENRAGYVLCCVSRPVSSWCQGEN